MCLEGTTPQDLPQSALIALVQIRATEQVAIINPLKTLRVDS